jgi:hypothetical protein
MIPKPTRSEIAQAFEDGAEVKAGFPTCVRTDKATHVLDLVSAMRGDPDPWHSFTKNDDLIEMASANYRSLYWVPTERSRVATYRYWTASSRRFLQLIFDMHQKATMQG